MVLIKKQKIINKKKKIKMMEKVAKNNSKLWSNKRINYQIKFPLTQI